MNPCFYLLMYFKIRFQKSLNTLRCNFHMMMLLDVLGKIAWVRSDFLPMGKISDILIWCEENNKMSLGIKGLRSYCVVCLNKTLHLLLSSGSTQGNRQYMTEKLLTGA